MMQIRHTKKQLSEIQLPTLMLDILGDICLITSGPNDKIYSTRLSNYCVSTHETELEGYRPVHDGTEVTLTK